jgi:hypothetical protein
MQAAVPQLAVKLRTVVCVVTAVSEPQELSAKAKVNIAAARKNSFNALFL